MAEWTLHNAENSFAAVVDSTLTGECPSKENGIVD